METMRILAKRDLATAYKSGQAMFGETTVVVSQEVLDRLTPEQREWLALSSRYGSGDNVYWKVVVELGRDGTLPLLDEGVAASLQAVHCTYLASLERKKERAFEALERLKAKFEADPDKDISYYGDTEEARTIPEGKAWIDEARRIHKERYDAQYEAKQREKAAADEDKKVREAAEQVAKDAVEAENRAVFSLYVDERGTSSQKKRFALGVLPEREIIEMVRAETFSSEVPAYKKLVETDIDCGDDCGRCVPKFCSEEYLGCMSEDVFDQIERIKADNAKLCPETKHEVRMHSAWCDNRTCDAGVTYRFSVRATVQWAGRTLQKSYALFVGKAEIDWVKENDSKRAVLSNQEH